MEVVLRQFKLNEMERVYIKTCNANQILKSFLEKLHFSRASEAEWEIKL